MVHGARVAYDAQCMVLGLWFEEEQKVVRNRREIEGLRPKDTVATMPSTNLVVPELG